MVFGICAVGVWAQPVRETASDTSISLRLETVIQKLEKQESDIQDLRRENAELKLELNRLRAEKSTVKRQRKTVVERRGSKQVSVQ